MEEDSSVVSSLVTSGSASVSCTKEEQEKVKIASRKIRAERLFFLHMYSVFIKLMVFVDVFIPYNITRKVGK